MIYRVHHSDLKDFAGFMSAALIDWKLIVSIATDSATNPAKINVHQWISVR